MKGQEKYAQKQDFKILDYYVAMRTILDLLDGGDVSLVTLRHTLLEELRRGLIRESEDSEAKRHLADTKHLGPYFQRVVA